MLSLFKHFGRQRFQNGLNQTAKTLATVISDIQCINYFNPLKIMKDLEILKKIEEKLNIKIGDYTEWNDSRKMGSVSRRKIQTETENIPLVKITNITNIGSLENKQLFKIDQHGNIFELYLNGLKLKEMPNEVFDLKHLKELHFVGNMLRDIPLELISLTNLEVLYLFNNKIEDIPNEIIFLENLKEIHLRKNPIKSIPIEVFESSKNHLTAIRNYINSLKKGTKNLNEVKVIIVGDGSSGKTSLQKILTNEIFNPNEQQTHGINIKHLTLKVNNQNVKYRLWDFGGQEIMHATHQIFLSRRSIYIIILNAREEPNPEYWLNHIKSFGGNSPVIIIINKIDENPSYDVNRLFLKEKYPNIIDFVKISCSENKGIKEVKLNLKKAVADIGNLNVAWALSWFKVKLHLENMSSNFISYDEFSELCNKNNINDSSSQNTLVEYLNDLGIILHFKDFSLSDTHVLDPEWVTYAVYKIINSKQLAENQGILKLTEIRNILKTMEVGGKFKYPSSQLNYIIELMVKFELCFKISESEILIPDLLAVQEPTFDIDGKERLEVIVSYSFLPKSIMPRLIVNLHNDISDNLRWRTGLIIYDFSLNTYAVLKADYEQKEIKITVIGDKKRDYLSVILFIIRKINGSFIGLDYKVNIPIDESKNIKVSHSHLLTLESKGISKFIPDGLDYEVDVQNILCSLQGSRTSEEEIFAILDKLVTKLDDQTSIAEKVNEIVQIQPNFFGLGINFNALAKKYLKRK
jgi:internalin A